MFLKAGIAVVAIIAGILIYVALLPSDFKVTRKIQINAPADVIFPHINNAKKMNDWNPFIKEDPTAKVTFSGPEEGIGAVTNWEGSKKSGKGMSTITASAPNLMTLARIDFEKPFQGSNQSEFNLRSDGLQTTVIWSVYGKSTFIPKLFCALFMNIEKVLGGSLEKGLAELKAVSEADALK